jgi:ferric-dicitrate binding protein FerR (iron transport regulator)
VSPFCSNASLRKINLFMDQSSRLNFLFEKWLRRNCSPEEVKELVLLLQQDPTPASLHERLSVLWNKVLEEDVAYPVDWEGMYQRVIQSEKDLPVMGRQHHLVWLKVAAAVLILFGGTLIWHYAITPSAISEKAGITETLTLQKDKPSPIDKKQTIHLPDGSTAILNADSHLDYPSAFTGKTREIYLSGEAYFDIKPDPSKPFLVHTEKIITRVLGTAFDIRAYPGDETIKVTVTRGKVQVLKENRSLGLISANQQISFSKTTEKAIQKTVDSKALVAWKPEEIAFNDISMLDAAKKIAERFNVQVEFVNPQIKNCRITATFSEDDMLDDMLTVICGVTKCQYTIQNNKIMIDGKGCSD